MFPGHPPRLPPLPVPDLSIPPSPSTVTVRIINTTAWRKSPTSRLFHPSIPGFKTALLPSWSFLISHPIAAGARSTNPTNVDTTSTDAHSHVLFDLGIRHDFRTGFPPIFDALIDNGTTSPGPEELSQFHISVAHSLPSILESDPRLRIKPADVSSIVLSHHHFDHIGDPSLFPPSTSLTVGPGLTTTYLPGYPRDPDGELFDSDFTQRPVRELSAADFTLVIGGLPAHDYFGDGSLYLLSAPGHTVGHMCALARVTTAAISPTSSPSPDTPGTAGGRSTFVLLAGDTAHHPAVFRPSPYLPLPAQLSIRYPDAGTPQHSSDLTPSPPHLPHRTSEKPTAGAADSGGGTRTGAGTHSGPRILSHLHPHKDPSSARTTPFLLPDDEPMCHNRAHTAASISKLQAFDASDDVLVCIAHDATLHGILPTFPETLNGWKQCGIKEDVRWEFLREFDLRGCYEEDGEEGVIK